MDFAWIEQQQTAYKDTLEARRRAFPPRPPADTGQHYTRQQWRTMGKLGVLGLCLPNSDGGRGRWGRSETAALIETLGRGCPDAALLFAASAPSVRVRSPHLQVLQPAGPRGLPAGHGSRRTDCGQRHDEGAGRLAREPTHGVGSGGCRRLRAQRGEDAPEQRTGPVRGRRLAGPPARRAASLIPRGCVDGSRYPSPMSLPMASRRPPNNSTRSSGRSAR